MHIRRGDVPPDLAIFCLSDLVLLSLAVLIMVAVALELPSIKIFSLAVAGLAAAWTIAEQLIHVEV